MGDISDNVAQSIKRKRKSVHVAFSEDDDIINPGKILI